MNKDESKFYATSTDDYHYVNIFKPDGEFLFIVNVESADKLLKVLNDLNIGKINAENVLTDFMNVLNELIGFLHKDIGLSKLDNFDEVIQLIHVSKDMLQNMNMELKE